MSLQLQPQRTFTVVRQLANHQDSSTYYVQAVIRDAYSDAILATVQLADKGGQRFKYDWKVPADRSGEGFYVSIVTSVYDDSGYTTKSGNYGDEENTYLVIDHLGARRGGFQLGSFGLAGGGIDARTTRRIIREELDTLPKPQEVDLSAIPKPIEYKMRWDEILGALSSVESLIRELKIPELDVSPVLARLDGVQKAITDKEVTPETDLSPVLSLIREKADDNDLDAQEMREIVSAIESGLPSLIEQALAKVLRETKFKSEVVMEVADHGEEGDEPRPARESRQKRPKITDITRLAT